MKGGDMIASSDTKARAVFLMALMFLWVFAGTVAFAGGVAAQSGGDVEYGIEGSFAYQGQEVYAFGAPIDETGFYELRSVAAFDAGVVDDSRFEKELETDQYDGNTTINEFAEDYSEDTLALVLSEGFFNDAQSSRSLSGISSDIDSASSSDTFAATFSGISSGDTAALIEIKTDDQDAGNYYVTGNGLPTDGELVRAGTFEVGIQDLSVAFNQNDVPVINEGGDSVAKLEVGSSRGQYSLNVSANGDLTSEELFSIFAPGADLQTALDNRVDEGIDDSSAGFGPFNAAIYTTENSGSDDRIILINIRDSENDVGFTDIPSGDYEFNVDVTDTEAQASETISVFEDIDQSNLTYTFEIPNDGEMYSLGIPGETEGTLADIVDPTAEGYTVFRFVDGEWTPVTDFESTTLNALDAIAIATEGASGQPDTFSLEVELATQSATTVPPQTSLTEGWNFVAAPQRGDADTVLAVQHSFLVLDRFNQPSSEYLRGVGKFNTHYIGSDSQTVSPFKGYYVYAEDDTTLPGVLTGVETRTDVDEQLNLDTFSKLNSNSVDRRGRE